MIVTHCDQCATRMVKNYDEVDEGTYELACPQCGLLDNPRPKADKLKRAFGMKTLGIEKYRRIMGQEYANE